MGLVTKNAILLIDFAKHSRKQGNTGNRKKLIETFFELCYIDLQHLCDFYCIKDAMNLAFCM